MLLLTAEVDKANKLSVQQTTNIISWVLNIGGANLHDYNISNTSFHSERTSFQDREKISNDHLKDIPITIYFDGKLVKANTKKLLIPTNTVQF